MNAGECRYVHTYSEIPGLQGAHRLVYCACAVPEGVQLELRAEQADGVYIYAALCPGGVFAPLARAMQYLSENSVGPTQWLEALADLGWLCEPLEPKALCAAAPDKEFCGFCQI